MQMRCGRTGPFYIECSAGRRARLRREALNFEVFKTSTTTDRLRWLDWGEFWGLGFRVGGGGDEVLLLLKENGIKGVGWFEGGCWGSAVKIRA